MDEEVNHVKIGMKWFKHLCLIKNIDPMLTWQQIVRKKIPNVLPGPFNECARELSDFPSSWYLPVSDQQQKM